MAASRHYQKHLLIPFLFTALLFPPSSSSSSSSLWRDLIGYQPRTLPHQVKVSTRHGKLVVENGLVELHFSTPEGFITQIKYMGHHEILAPNEVFDRGYWDVVWNNNSSSNKSTTWRIVGSRYEIMEESADKVEISFSTAWDRSSLHGNAGLSLNIDRRFVMLAGDAGFYTYAIFERDMGWPVLNIDQIRMVFKLRDKFNYMALSDERQRTMPRAVDRVRGEPLAYPEAVLLTEAGGRGIRGEVDDKYQYSCDNRDNRVHGWVAPWAGIGFWIITPSNEFKPGGPLRQDLTSHVGPIALSMFVSLHYVGEDGGIRFEEGEPWQIVFGPVFIYMNHGPAFSSPRLLWDDAKSQMMKEREKWPYSFPLSPYFPNAAERGRVAGRLVVCDRFVSNEVCGPWPSAQLGLAKPGTTGSWQTESKGYQFWSRADGRGRFVIEGVRAGTYGLYGWVTGALGDFMHNSTVTVVPGMTTRLGRIEFWPPRAGPTLWEIGIPDRTGREFSIPCPDPRYVNRLYLEHDRFRQYGLWERYTALYPTRDLVFVVGISDFRKHWFYAQVPRIVNEETLEGTTWRILFRLEEVCSSQTYVLRLALAATHLSSLEIRFNGREGPEYRTGVMGKDNAIARHGIHGVYRLHSVEVEGGWLVKGWNTIYLTQPRNATLFEGIIYDYIRLEGALDY